VFAYLVTKGGLVREHVLNFDSDAPTITSSREYQLAGQAEGCVVDDRTGRLYVGEEEAAIWLFDLNGDGFQPQRFANVNGRELVGDVEGLAIAPDGANGGYLVASSQGDNAYALYDLLTGRFVFRFRLVDGAVDGTSETDGIEVISGSFGPDYPGGLMVVQDGSNEGRTQNFKLISWQKVLNAVAQ
ncbi:MAG: phytase, partial [Pseudomonadota bacterium]